MDTPQEVQELQPWIPHKVQGEELCGGVGEISGIPKVKGESHPKQKVSVVVSIVKSRQVSEVKKKKSSKTTSVSGGGGGETRCRNRSFRSAFRVKVLQAIRLGA